MRQNRNIRIKRILSTLLLFCFVYYFVLSSDIFLIWHIPPARPNITIPSSKNDWQISGQDWSSFCQPQSSHTAHSGDGRWETENKRERERHQHFLFSCWMAGVDRLGTWEYHCILMSNLVSGQTLNILTLSTLHP